jgi:hypothetical protein
MTLERGSLRRNPDSNKLPERSAFKNWVDWIVRTAGKIVRTAGKIDLLKYQNMANLFWTASWARNLLTLFTENPFFNKSYLLIPWRDSISRPIALVSSVAGADGTSRPRRQGYWKYINNAAQGDRMSVW